eukprot:5446395-Alexandrium_andersonii.AAC.1
MPSQTSVLDACRSALVALSRPNDVRLVGIVWAFSDAVGVAADFAGHGTPRLASDRPRWLRAG